MIVFGEDRITVTVLSTSFMVPHFVCAIAIWTALRDICDIHMGNGRVYLREPGVPELEIPMKEVRTIKIVANFG